MGGRDQRVIAMVFEENATSNTNSEFEFTAKNELTNQKGEKTFYLATDNRVIKI